jgi:hypothetical protein
VETLEDLLDPRIMTDECLKHDIGMRPIQIRKFRLGVQKYLRNCKKDAQDEDIIITDFADLVRLATRVSCVVSNSPTPRTTRPS